MRAPRDIGLEAAADRVLELVESTSSPDLIATARLARQRVSAPASYVTVAGETSTGKSTLINALLGRRLLPAMAKPTTATVTHLVVGASERDRFFAIYRDGTQDEIDRSAFARSAEAPDSDLLRLQIRTPPSGQAPPGLHVFDTPGFNSLVAEHEEVLREFLPQSDVVVFTTGYRTGFGQVDQELLELVAEATRSDPELPFVLVINRTPPGVGRGDKRVAEIVANAEDSLRIKPQVVLVTSAFRDEAEFGANDLLPEATGLWRIVTEIVSKPERAGALQARLRELLLALCDAGLDHAQQKLSLLSADEEQLRCAREQIDILRDAERRSYDAIASCTKRLQLTLPPSIEAHTRRIVDTIAEEIERSDKWLGKDDCAEYIVAHALPFEVRRAGSEIELQIARELESLDAELQEIANTAVAAIQAAVRVPSDASRKMAESLGRRLLERFGGAAIYGALRGFGGIGGAAAGAGNFAKALVKRVGTVFGKRFGREVYLRIGKMFNKRMLQKLNVVAALLIEAGVFVFEASRWKADLKKRVAQAMDDWKAEVIRDVVGQQLRETEEANQLLVRDIYERLIAEQESHLASVANGIPAEQRTELETLAASFAELKAELQTEQEEAA